MNKSTGKDAVPLSPARKPDPSTRITIVQDRFGEWHVWFHLEEGEPSELSESFIIGTSDIDRLSAILAALDELDALKLALLDCANTGKNNIP